jgi:hypothetical protein
MGLHDRVGPRAGRARAGARETPEGEPMAEITMTEITAPPEVVVSLTPDELLLVRAALRLLLSTLGRDEAEEVEEVKTLLMKLEAA